MAGLLGDQSSGPAGLRRLLDAETPLLLPGCQDPLSAVLIEQAGFDAVYMTGFGTTATHLGRPDVGLLGLSEMVDNAGRIVGATSLPVVADADTGYGNPINVIRTVREFERAGVAGIHIEDQVMPKKCGHMENKSVIPTSDLVAKIDAAVTARTDDDFVIIARTDARAPHGVDEAIGRAKACHAAGADLLFVEALQDETEIELVCRELDGIRLVFNWVDGGKTPPLSLDRITELGFAMVIMPVTLLFAATKAMADTLAILKADGTPANLSDRVMDFAAFTDLVGLPEIQALEARFAPDPS